MSTLPTSPQGQRLTMLIAPPQYDDLLQRIVAALDPQPRPKPLLIGIDGLDGSGKTSLAM